MVCGNFLRRVRELFLFELVLCSLICTSCQKTSEHPANTRLTIGTFNMEWFGDNTPDDHKPRTAQDIMLLAEVVRCAEADILAIQEIENEQAMKRLLEYLPEYSFVLGTSGGKQHVGFLYKSDLAITPLGEVTSIAIQSNRTRAGLLVQCQVGAQKWLLLGLHLKSTSRADSTPELEQHSRELRSLQAAQVRAWSDSVLAADSLAHFVILGDCNDSPMKKKSTLDTLKNSPYLVFLTSQMRSCTYEGLPAIDHIICSKQAIKRFARGSLHSLNTHAMLKEHDAKRVSDHCPVVCQFDFSDEFMDNHSDK
jgi:endonuclease/exonuclease/phosphatase family metal-dependent hydrolase